MNLRTLTYGIALGIACSIAISGLLSTSAKATLQPDTGEGMPAPSPEEMQKMMDAWAAVMNPGPHHKLLNQFVGSWDTKTKMWFGGPGTPATESTGSSEIKWILDKHFIQEYTKSSFMMPDATGKMNKIPFQGIGTTGYDNYRNLYTGLWMDSLGTQMLTMKGSASPDGKKLTMYGEMDEPMLNVTGRMVKYVITIKDENHYTFESYDLHAGDHYKVMEITYTRK